MNPGRNLKTIGYVIDELCEANKKELVIGKIVKDAIMQFEDAPSRTSSCPPQRNQNWNKELKLQLQFQRITIQISITEIMPLAIQSEQDKSKVSK